MEFASSCAFIPENEDDIQVEDIYEADLESSYLSVPEDLLGVASQLRAAAPAAAAPASEALQLADESLLAAMAPAPVEGVNEASDAMDASPPAPPAAAGAPAPTRVADEASRHVRFQSTPQVHFVSPAASVASSTPGAPPAPAPAPAPHKAQRRPAPGSTPSYRKVFFLL